MAGRPSILHVLRGRPLLRAGRAQGAGDHPLPGDDRACRSPRRSCAGLINLRGQIVTAIDLRRRLELRRPARGPTPRQRRRSHRRRRGQPARGRDRRRAGSAGEGFRAPARDARGDGAELIRGAYKLEDRLLLILDTERSGDPGGGTGKSDDRRPVGKPDVDRRLANGRPATIITHPTIEAHNGDPFENRTQYTRNSSRPSKWPIFSARSPRSTSRKWSSNFSLDGTILTANDKFLEGRGLLARGDRGRHHGIFVDEATVKARVQGILGRTRPRRVSFGQSTNDSPRVAARCGFRVPTTRSSISMADRSKSSSTPWT